MNFRYFQTLLSNSDFDEIKVIGKEIKKDDNPYHIIGMTLKDKKACLHVLEAPDYLVERGEFEEEEQIGPKKRTPRNSMKEDMMSEVNQSLFLHMREIHNGDNVLEMSGGQSGAIRQGDYLEAYILFAKMSEAGWEMSQDFLFYTYPWDFLAVTNIELRGEFDSLPEWNEDMEIFYDVMPKQYPVEKSVLLECGKTTDIEFNLEDGKKAICYINKIELHDIWAGQEERFTDPKYVERVLEHMSEEEFEKMKEDFYKILEEHCPKGKCFMAMEYECSDENIGLQFYDKEYLDTIPQPSSGSCSGLMMNNKPEKETGIHGLKLRGAIIQKPLDKEVTNLEAELFSYHTMVEKKQCRLSELIYTPLPEPVMTEEEKEAIAIKYDLIKPDQQ